MCEIVYDLVCAKDLLEANEILKMIDIMLADQNEDRKFLCKKLAQAIASWTVVDKFTLLSDKKPAYYIISERSAIPHYFATHGLMSSKIREVKKAIKYLINHIDNNIISPSGNFITIEQQKNILSVLTQKFPFWETVCLERALDIVNIKNTDRIYNSLCGISSEGKPIAIYMFHMKDSTISPEYVFLHELGHVLQVSLTGSTCIIPNEFVEFNNSLPAVEKLEQGNPDFAEVFADTFAIAVMYNTELWCYDPFHFPDDLNRRFEIFYRRLFDKYKQ